MSHRIQNNQLLAKSDVGKSKTYCIDLPAGDMIYGKQSKCDAEGVRSVTSSWKQHDPSRDTDEDIQDFQVINRMTLKAKAVDPKSSTAFRHTLPAVALCPNGVGKLNKSTVPDKDPSFAYGKSSVKSDSVNAIVVNTFGRVR
eukprot:GHVL01023903.1.p1 GENE.GHVL01023903.1~~GHVL01023903.1.p1  ORF type:complete len:142 (+),score=18.65 GHVL01023903.1:125-550(+)